MKVFQSSFLSIALICIHPNPVNGEVRLGSPQKYALGEQRELQERGSLNYVGDEGQPAGAFPLGHCEGDCDVNQDCQGTMVCFQRLNGDTRAIPGCDGEPIAGRDYCYYESHADELPGSSKTDLFLRDEAVTPISITPLALCEGDCRHNGECAGSLECFQRGGNEPVPGCTGSGFPGIDFCYDANSFDVSPPTSVPTPAVTKSPTSLPSTQTTNSPTSPPSTQATPAPSSSPGSSSQAPTATSFSPVPLVLIGNNRPFALGHCEGDCDDDTDCEGPLTCFQRALAVKEVPGCLGEARGNWDYCYFDPNANANAGDATPNPTPGLVTLPPLSKLTSSPTLPPFTSSPTASPTGLPTSPPPSPAPTTINQLVMVGDNNDPSSAFPLKVCQGDCDNDDDCEGELECWQRGNGDPHGPPNSPCVGTPHLAKDYCYDPSTAVPTPSPTEFSTVSPTTTNDFDGATSELNLVGDDGNPVTSYPLAHCEGDCDNDDECEGSMVCFQRNNGDTSLIPGCTGTPEAGRDYCYYESQTPSPTDGFGGSSTSSPTAPPFTAPPGPTGSPTPSPTHIPTSLPTTGAPTPAPTPGANELTILGNNNKPSSAYPLGHCKGDCDDDDDCEGALECYQRTDFRPVPGCVGQGEGGRDYCYDPADGDQGDQDENKFKLKLYWQSGYMWQESPKEQKWCMLCKGGSCKSNEENELLVDYCDKSNMEFEFLYPEGNGTLIKMIGKDLCLARTNVRALRASRCNETSVRQRWYSGVGDFHSDQFEIKPLNKEGCVSQHHHPKPDEMLYVETCAKAHRAETGYWSRYYD